MTQKTFILEGLGEAERVALAYAPRALRPGYEGLFLLDAQLRRSVIGAREPMLAQIKLAWWREALASLEARAAAHPVLLHLAHLPGGGAAAMVPLVDGWEELGAGQRGFAAGVDAAARGRGESLARLAGLPHADPPVLRAARCWTMAELARFAPDRAQADALIGAARALPPAHLPRVLRPLAVLHGLARRATLRGGAELLGDRLSPLAALRLGIFGR